MSITLCAETDDCPIQLSSALLKPELSDVQISVVGKQKKPKLFHAHKLLLSLASDVFKTMFIGSVPQENPVAFEAFLRFVYTGTTTITEAEVFPLLYLAKKYMVGSLIKVVMNHLEECITAENVGHIVLAGQNFLDDAPPKFWKSVETHGEALLQSSQFLQLRKDALRAVVQRELQVEEKLIYERAVAWAKSECARNQLPAGGETLRNALEGIVQHLRFPTMTAEEFAHGPDAEGVLTDGEKVQVFRWFTAAIPQTLVPDALRFTTETYICERLTIRAISVTGFGDCIFYNNGSQTGSRYSIVAKLALNSVVLATQDLNGMISETSQTVLVNFGNPPKTNANKRYTASVVVTGPSTYYGYKGTWSKTVTTKRGDIVFNFVQSSSSANTNVAQAMVPKIHFRIKTEVGQTSVTS